ncbi:MAG: linearmycin/streptolysin transport system ATP-binding protein [Halanaerobiales bacterium]|nr:linearmycin/streptolysin transport system ATP-binding protein [Halanaerobiales bacterium]
MNAIYVENLTKKYGNDEVLKGVNLRIEEGEFYALMGPNGSGKTTLVSIMTSVRSPTSGKVEIYGRRPEQAKEFIGYVPQESFSCPTLTGKENLMYFARLLGYTKRQAERLVDEILDKVGLSEEANKRVSNYSGGMRKRLEVATALFPGIRILILDEPTTGLDPSTRRKFFGLIEEIKEAKTTILLITHIGADAELASRVGLINEGKIIAEDEPERLKKASGLENVINIETVIKSRKVANMLSKFSEGAKILETDVGYRIYCRDAEKAIPEIVRSLDEIGCKATRIETIKPSLEDVFFKLTGKTIKEVS